MENFIEYDSLLDKSFLNNVIYHKNLVSPFSNIQNFHLTSVKKKELIIDTNYGLIYDNDILLQNLMIYGKEDLLPKFSGDSFANYGFLRVPFRKIPRVLVKNKQELLNIVHSIYLKDDNLDLVFRGQSKEHLIERTNSEKEGLFGDKNSMEPSLTPSSSRKGISHEDILPIWNNIIQIYLDSNLELRKDKLSEYDYERIYKKNQSFKFSSDFGLFSLGLAQHYGLPSVGLDVTPDIETALYFATHSFIKKNGKCYYENIINEIDSPPVIYILAPAKRFNIDHFMAKPEYSDFLRPDRQQAKFLHTGWGLMRNQCARHIFMAIYLEPKGDFYNSKTTKELFPIEDSFANMINQIRNYFDDPEIKKYFNDFYIVEV